VRSALVDITSYLLCEAGRRGADALTVEQRAAAQVLREGVSARKPDIRSAQDLSHNLLCEAGAQLWRNPTHEDLRGATFKSSGSPSSTVSVVAGVATVSSTTRSSGDCSVSQAVVDRSTKPRSPKGSFIAWLSAHLPRIDAWLRGDVDTWRELVDHDAAREEMFGERLVFCITCRALLIHAKCGHYYCPYQRAGVHAHAVKAAHGPSGGKHAV
jgi:hypothetical protein